MRLLAFLFVAFSFVRAEIALEGNVLVLNDDNFAEAVGLYPEMLVEFYAPWCGHCKTLAPEWTKAGDQLKESSVKLAKVDATIATELAKEYGIKGFPTIKFVKKGKAGEYNGGRTAKDIVSWVNKKSGPVTKTITTELELLALQEANEVAILGVFSSLDSANARAFTALAADAEEGVYAVAADDVVRAKLGLTEDTVVVFKSFDDLRADLSVESGVDAEATAAFIAGESSPLVQEFSAESSKKIFKSTITKHALVFTKKSADHHATVLATIKTVAAEHKGQALFINVPASTETQRVLDYFDIKDSDLPKFILADMAPAGGSMKKYPFVGALEAGPMSAFVSELLAGSLKPVLKSEEATAEDTAGPVVVVKGTSFADIVIDNTNDVFIEFYAPWCGHCKQLSATWDSLGAEFASNPTITIAKMDATANEIDVDGIAVQGFPTIFFLKGDGKNTPVKYEGGRELEDLVAYVKANAHTTFAHEEL